MRKSIGTRALSLLLVCISLFSLCMVSFSASAEDGIEPYFNNLISASNSFRISSTGKMTVTNSYDGIPKVTIKAVITTYVEKKTLGLFWTRVDIGTTDNQWVDTIYNYTYAGSHSFQLSSKGTYRVTTKFEIFGTGGLPDEFIVQKEETY